MRGPWLRKGITILLIIVRVKSSVMKKKTHGLKTCIIGGNMECYFIVQDGSRSLVGDVITFSQTKVN
jgi:hypothetical protein